MQLTFNSLDELRDMIAAMGYVKPSDVTETVQIDIPADTIKRLIERSPDGVADSWSDATGERLDELASIPPRPAERDNGSVGGTDTIKRKRRTKAEIEADKAAEAAANAAPPAVPTPPSPLDNLKPESESALADENAWAWARPKIEEQAALFDGNDKLAHLNEGRQFIEAHGFPSYNDTLQLADVPPNIAGHTPEQVSRHRAAMAWLAAHKTKG